MEDLKFIRYEADGGVARLILDRPPANVMHIAMLRELEGAIATARFDESLKVLVLGAEGKLFSAGVDVADHTEDRVGEMIPLFDKVCLDLARLPIPTIAIVQGRALGGGCELVICCDMAFMAAGARIGQPEIQLAVMAPIAALSLPLLVGPRWATRIVLAGEQVEAAKAAEIGLVDAEVPAEGLHAAVEEWVKRFTALSGAALRFKSVGLCWERGLGPNLWGRWKHFTFRS